MPHYRIAQAAELLGVSDDTLRRWIDQGHLAHTTDNASRQVVDGAELARFAQDRAQSARPEGISARNAFTGLVTRVVSDQVMSSVELQCGPYRVMSLISTEAVRDLGLEPGVIATARIKATNVVIEGHAS